MSRGTPLSKRLHALPAKLRSACADSQADHTLRCPPEDDLGLWLPTVPEEESDQTVRMRWARMHPCRKYSALVYILFEH